jgi:hypothetical protein
MENARGLLRAGIERGELRAGLDVDVAVGLLVGPVFYRRLVSREPLDDALVRLVVDQFLLGASVERGSA